LLDNLHFTLLLLNEVVTTFTKDNNLA